MQALAPHAHNTHAGNLHAPRCALHIRMCTAHMKHAHCTHTSRTQAYAMHTCKHAQCTHACALHTRTRIACMHPHALTHHARPLHTYSHNTLTHTHTRCKHSHAHACTPTACKHTYTHHSTITGPFTAGPHEQAYGLHRRQVRDVPRHHKEAWTLSRWRSSPSNASAATTTTTARLCRMPSTPQHSPHGVVLLPSHETRALPSGTTARHWLAG